MKLVISRMDLEHLILWASQARSRALEVDVPFEPDEIDLIRKLYTARDRARHSPPDVTAEWQADLDRAPLGIVARTLRQIGGAE